MKLAAFFSMAFLVASVYCQPGCPGTGKNFCILFLIFSTFFVNKKDIFLSFFLSVMPTIQMLINGNII